MSLLNTVVTGKKLKPLAIMLHGVHGLGKTTFAAEAPKPIFIGCEENDEIEAARFPKVEKWSDFESQLGALLNEKHDYKSVVFDTMDGMETLAESKILSEKSNIGKTMKTADGGFGKAYDKMKLMFLNIREKYIVPLREKKGMNIIILSHSSKVKHEDPLTLTSYDHYETALDKRVKPIFEDWVSAILFVTHQVVRAETSSGKEYAQDIDGRRIIYTEERPSHVAKNRFNLPYEIDFEKTGTWNKLKCLILAHYKEEKKKSVEKNETFSDEALELKKSIQEKLKDCDEMQSVAISKSLLKAGSDPAELKRILTKIEQLFN